MTSTDSHPYRLTRRRALAGAAWSAPVIVAASAVPAFAGSPGGSLTLQPGSTMVVPGVDAGTGATTYDLQFTGLSVLVPVALTAGQLTLTVTFTPTVVNGASNLYVVQDIAAPFTASAAAGSTVSSVVLTYGAAAAAGFEIQVPNGVFVGADQPIATQTGTYVVTAAATGLASDTRTFATPTMRATRQMAVVQRPVL